MSDETASALPERTHRGTPIIAGLLLISLAIPVAVYVFLGKPSRITPEQRAAARAQSAAKAQAEADAAASEANAPQ